MVLLPMVKQVRPGRQTGKPVGDKTILVIGAYGFIGSAIARMLTIRWLMIARPVF